MSLSQSTDHLLPPANEVCEGYVFTGVCHSVHSGGGMRVAPGGHVWLLGGHAWLLRGDIRDCSGGACVVAPRGCVIALGGCGCSRGGMHGFF